MTTSIPPVLRSKLRPPELPAHHVRRERLHALLDELVAAPLTAVIAPAGTGKSTLVAAWAAESALPLAWLSLDAFDAGHRFLEPVLEALWALLDGLGAVSSSRRAGNGRSTAGDLLMELESLSAPPSSVTLVLDDVQLIEADDAVTSSVSQFISHMPPWLHVILISRHEPLLPLPRLRARGQLGEIRYPELKFSLEEERALLSGYGAWLPPEQVEAMAGLADGWAASLQLGLVVARTARARERWSDIVFLNRMATMDYVAREVLAELPAVLLTALRDLAVVDRFSRGLGQALCPDVSVEDVVLGARVHGLLTEVTPPENWFEAFELPSFVVSTLRSDLEQRDPAHRAAQHARAARWFEDADELELAVDHWLAAGQPREALRTVASAQSSLHDLRPEETLARVVRSVPYQVANADFESMVDTAWCYLTIDRRRYLEVVEDIGWNARRWQLSQTQLARLSMLQSIAQGARGNWVEAATLATAAMTALGPAAWSDPLGRFGWNVLAREVALSERWDDLSDEVHRATVSLAGDPPRHALLEGTRALGLALSGHPIDALRVAAGIRVVAEAGRMPLLSNELAVAEALAHLELGERSTALAELTALAGTPMEATLYCQVLAATSLVEAHLDCGDVDGARSAFDRAKSLIETESFGSSGVDRLGRAGVRLSLASGDPDVARQWSDRIGDEVWAALCAASCCLAVGDTETTQRILDGVVPRSPRHEVVLALLKARTTPDRETAMKYAVTAMEQASSLGMLQTVAAYDTGITDLLEASAWRVSEGWMNRLEQATAALGELEDLPRGYESLTERERDVLRFLPSRLTVQEIADQLYISRNTLKFHLKVIYRKLGVGSRVEASEIARQLR